MVRHVVLRLGLGAQFELDLSEDLPRTQRAGYLELGRDGDQVGLDGVILEVQLLEVLDHLALRVLALQLEQVCVQLGELAV